MAAFHLTVVRPLTRLYSRWALENFRLAAALASAEEQDPETAAKVTATIAPAVVDDNARAYDLSRSEEIRIMRALYQCETHFHLVLYPRATTESFLLASDINDTFSSLFDPWEAEAIGCIYLFFKQRFELCSANSKSNSIQPILDPAAKRSR